MPIVIGVRFKETGRTYFFNPRHLEVQSGDSVIVETARGLEYGDVIVGPREVPEDQVVAPLKDVMRIATEKDIHRLAENKCHQKEAFVVCEEKVLFHKLPMKLIDVEYTFDRKKILFYFTSDGRVDFRDLVKDLAATFKTRIELRQIGVRDEAKMLGGLGSCGREVCCKGFLHDFRPVTIKMAKDQGISLNPTKISGLCGRLMCCLEYEHEVYKEARKLLRKNNSKVMTPNGPGTVLDTLMLQEKCKVKVILPGDSYEILYFTYAELTDISEDQMDAEVKKVKSTPANAFSIKNPYETWDDSEDENKEKRAANSNNRRNSNNSNSNNNRNRNNNNRNRTNTRNNDNKNDTNSDSNKTENSNDNRNNSQNNRNANRDNKNPNNRNSNQGNRNNRNNNSQNNRNPNSSDNTKPNNSNSGNAKPINRNSKQGSNTNNNQTNGNDNKVANQGNPASNKQSKPQTRKTGSSFYRGKAKFTEKK